MRGGRFPNLSRPGPAESARDEFRLVVSDVVEIARAVCEGRPESELRPAMAEARASGENVYTFGALDYLSDKLARVLSDSGVGRGDRVAAVLDPSAALVIACVAAWKAGAVVVPLSLESEPRQVAGLMKIASPRAVILQESFDPTLGEWPDRSNIFIVSDDIHNLITAAGERSFWREIYAAPSDFEPVAGLGEPHAFLFRVKREGAQGR